MTAFRSRCRGCLVGAAVGDALGAPLEFLTKPQILERYGRVTDFVPVSPGHPNAGLLPGQFTDDTKLLVAMAEALIPGQDGLIGFNEAVFVSRLVAWYKSGDLRCAGKATKAACKALLKGRSPGESGVPNSLGGGAAVRAAPLGLLYSLGNDYGPILMKECQGSTIITHKDARAVGATAAIAGAVAILKGAIQPLSAKMFLRSVSTFSAGAEGLAAEGLGESREYPDTFGAKLDRVRELLGLSTERGLHALGNGGSVMECVPAAIFAFVNSPRDFEHSLFTAVNSGGDADTLGALVGALSGAYNGIDAIPERLMAQLEDRDKLIALADALAAAAA